VKLTGRRTCARRRRRGSRTNYRLATLSSKDAKLTMEIGVEKGRGYVMADRQRNVEHMIG